MNVTTYNQTSLISSGGSAQGSVTFTLELGGDSVAFLDLILQRDCIEGESVVWRYKVMEVFQKMGAQRSDEFNFPAHVKEVRKLLGPGFK